VDRADRLFAVIDGMLFSGLETGGACVQGVTATVDCLATRENSMTRDNDPGMVAESERGAAPVFGAPANRGLLEGAVR
jgi:hypothetical protein